MTLLKKATVALAAASVAMTPVAASAAQFDSLRVDTAVAGEAMGEGAGATSWVLGLIGLGLFVFGIIELADGGDDTPTSP